MRYGDLVREACARKGMMITHVEAACGFPKGTTHRWNKVIPQIDKFEKVADVLECSIDELCGRTYYVQKQEKETDAVLENLLRFQQELNATRTPDDLTDDERSIIRTFRALPDAKKTRFLFSLLNLQEDDPQ